MQKAINQSIALLVRLLNKVKYFIYSFYSYDIDYPDRSISKIQSANITNIPENSYFNITLEKKRPVFK